MIMNSYIYGTIVLLVGAVMITMIYLMHHLQLLIVMRETVSILAPLMVERYLMKGAPMKVSVATSKFLLSITDTSAAWIYLNKGAVIPLLVVPSLVGIMLGSFVGVRILKIAKPSFIRWMVIVILLFAGLKAISKGLEHYCLIFFI